MTPTSTPILRIATAKPAVMYVFPTSVSVPVMNSDFNKIHSRYYLINSSADEDHVITYV
jgi:hypothetical protein